LWVYNFTPGYLPLKPLTENSILPSSILVKVIYWFVIIIAFWNLKYRPLNKYEERSTSPKNNVGYFKVLPKKALKTYAGSLIVLTGGAASIVIKTGFSDWPNPYWVYGDPAFHCLLICITLILARQGYEKEFDKLWPDDSDEVTMIIKYKSLLKGKIPDGLAHLEEGDLVKLVPSDVPAEEKSTINVVNERTPNGPVLMDRIFSKSLVKRLESTHIGYMYGEVSRFKASNHIELTLSKDHIALRSDYRDYDGLDELFVDAARLVVQTQQGSPSLIQRKFEIGYNRAGRIIDQLESKGIVGPFQRSRAREVLIASEEELQKRLDEIDNET
jgi:hypothetical protein